MPFGAYEEMAWESLSPEREERAPTAKQPGMQAYSIPGILFCCEETKSFSDLNGQTFEKATKPKIYQFST